MEIRGGIVGGSKNLFGILHHKLLLPTYNRALKPFVFLCAIHFLSTILLLQKKECKGDYSLSIQFEITSKNCLHLLIWVHFLQEII